MAKKAEKPVDVLLDDDVLEDDSGIDEEEINAALEDAQDAEDQDQDDDEDLDRPVVIQVEAKKPTTRRKPGRPKKEIEIDDELRDAIEQFGDSADWFIRLYRVEPTTDSRGRRIEGFLQRFNEVFTQEQVKEIYGGGTFDVHLHGTKYDPQTKKRRRGVIRMKRRFKISGDPKSVTDESGARGEKEPNQEIVGMVLKSQKEMLDKMQDEKRELQERSRESQSSGQQAFEMMNGFMTQILEIQKQSNERAQEDRRRHEEQMRAQEERFEKAMVRQKEEARDSFTPLITLMMESSKNALTMMSEQNRASQEKTDLIIKQMELMTKNQAQSMTEAFRSQITLQEEARKSQNELLMGQLQVAREEVSSMRKGKEGGALGELRNLIEMRSLLRELGSDDTPEEGTFDKVMKNLPEITEGFSSVAGIVAGAMKRRQTAAPKMVQQQQPQELALNELKKPMMDEPQPQPQPQPPIPEEGSVEYEIDKMLEICTKYMEQQKDPKILVREEIMGNYDEETLESFVKNFPAILPMLQQHLPDDHVLSTAAGKQFLKQVYVELRDALSGKEEQQEEQEEEVQGA